MRAQQDTYIKDNDDVPLLDDEKQCKLVGKREIKMSYKKMPIMWCAIQLFSPLVMGLLINAFSNGVIIKKRMAYQLGYATSYENADPNSLPKSIWSLGCLFPIGGLVGSLLSGCIVQKWGRKCSTLFFCVVVIIGSIVKIASYYVHAYMLIGGRFLDGVGAAGLMVTSVLHMFECLPEQLQGYFKPMIQINVNLGILIQAILQLEIVCHNSYQYTFASSFIGSILIMISTIALPESPAYLLDVKQDESAAIEVYKQLRGDNIAVEYLNLVKAQRENSDTKQESNISIIQLIGTRRFMGAIIASIFCHVAQQLSGINAVVAFSSSYLAGVGLNNPDLGSLLVIGMALIGSIIFSPCVSRFRRKFALLVGHIGILISLVGLLLTNYFNWSPYFKVIFMGLFVFVFQFGPGPLVWFITLEIFPANAIGAAQSLCTTFNWLANSIVYSIADYGIIALYLFTGVNVFIIIFMALFVVETLHKSSDEILEGYSKRFKCCN